MRTQLLYFLGLLFGILLLNGCEDRLDLEKQGATTFESFFITDEDAEEAIAAVYLRWRELYPTDWYVKNLLSDDAICGGGARGDNASMEQLNEYRFSPANTLVSGLFSGLYTIIYRSNLVINRFNDDSEIKKRIVAEAKTARAWAYFNLVTLWGPVPLVTTELAPSEYQQPNGNIDEIWIQIEKDLNEAINSEALPEKSGPVDKSIGARFSKQAAMAFLGKALLFQGKNEEAANILKQIITSEKYLLVDDYENVLRAKYDFGPENIFEMNALNDEVNPWSQGSTFGLPNMLGWRGDKLSMWGVYAGFHDLSATGWGFFNPSKEVYEAFVEIEGMHGFRLNSTMIMYEDVMEIGAPSAPITINPGTSLYGHEGYFSWKNRLLSSEAIAGAWGYSHHNNFRVMRYAEIVLMAAEACLLSDDPVNALIFINMIRERAQLPNLSSVTLDDIKKEKRLELWLESTRFQDLVRWGEAATVLANRGQKIPIFSGLNTDGTYIVSYPYNNTAFGFKSGKHELLPFPEHEMNVNKNLTQNPNW